MLSSPWSTLRHKTHSTATLNFLLSLSTPPCNCNYSTHAKASSHQTYPYVSISSPPIPSSPPPPPTISLDTHLPTNIIMTNHHANGHANHEDEGMEINGEDKGSQAKNGETGKREAVKLVTGDHLPNKKKVVSPLRIFHGKSFDARVDALKVLLTSRHVARLFIDPKTTPSQANRLLALAQKHGFADMNLLHAYIGFYADRGNVAEVMRGVALLRESGIAHTAREQREIVRAQNRARVFGEAMLRTEVLCSWVQLGDAEMCLRTYNAMRGAGANPGLEGYVELIRFFTNRGDAETSTRLVGDMDVLGLTSGTHGDAMRGVGVRKGELDVGHMKSLLRFHASLADRDACSRVLEEMRKRGMTTDDETHRIMATIDEINDQIVATGNRGAVVSRDTNFFNAHAQNGRKYPQKTSSKTPLSTAKPSTIPKQPKSIAEISKEKWKALKANGETPSEHFYIHLLRAAARDGDCDTCDELLAEMDATGIRRSNTVYSLMIEAHKGNYARAEELFNSLRTQCFTPTRAVYNTMLWILCAQRKVDDALALFSEMQPVADTRTYNTLMRVYAGDGNTQSVMELSAQMKARGIAHDVATYTVMTELLGRFGVKGATVVDAVVSEMEANNIQPDVVLYDVLMDIYGGTSEWEKCEKLWGDMEAKGVVLGAGSCARFLEKHCTKDPNLYLKWKKAFSNFLPP